VRLSARLDFILRIRPVMPATLMIAPDAFDTPLSRTNGSDSSRCSHPLLEGRQHHFPRGPANVRPLALVELLVAAVGDPVEGLDREQRLREVFQEQVAVLVEHRPDAGTLRNKWLASPALLTAGCKSSK